MRIAIIKIILITYLAMIFDIFYPNGSLLKITNMNIKKILPIFFIIIFLSCGKKRIASSVEAIERANIEVKTHIMHMNDMEVDSFPLSKLICDIRYIQLETTTDACLTMPTNVKMNKNFIYVSDNDEHLLCFDRNGKFIRKPFRNGRGKGEIIRMYDFDIDDKYLYVLDGALSSIVKFDHEGNYKETKKLPFRAIRFLHSKNGFIFQLAPYSLEGKDNDVLVATTDENFNVQGKYFNYMNNATPTTRTPCFVNGQYGVVYAPIFCRSIYTLNDSNKLSMSFYYEFNSPYYEQSKDVEGIKESVDNDIFYTYENAFQSRDYTVQNFVISKEKQGFFIANNKSLNGMFIRKITQDSNIVYDFNFSNTKFYDCKTDIFVGFAYKYYEGVHDEEITHIRAQLNDSVATKIIRGKEVEPFSENPLIILYRLCEDII